MPEYRITYASDDESYEVDIECDYVVADGGCVSVYDKSGSLLCYVCGVIDCLLLEKVGLKVIK